MRQIIIFSHESMLMPENMLTASEVARYLKVKIETVYNLIQKSELPAAKIGGQWRFRETELERWVQTQMGSGARQSGRTSNRRAPLSQEPSTGEDKP